MDVSIIIINYNTFEFTSNCIRSIIQFTDGIKYEITVVDNGSTNCDPDSFVVKFPNINLIKSPINGGFAYGNNLGIQNAQGEYILLLNSDTVLLENSVAECFDYMKTRESLGVVGCRTIYPTGDVQHTARRFRSIEWELLDLFRVIPMLLPYEKRSRLMLGKYFRHDKTTEVDWVNGAFFMFPRKILQQLPNNKLDDRFFMYGEDQLWCEQIKRAGYKIMFYSGTTIIHIANASTDVKKRLSLRKVMMQHELAIMRLRKRTRAYYFLFAIIYCFKETIRNLLVFLDFKFTGRPPR